MNSNIPFQTINWQAIQATTHAGETGFGFWKTLQLEGLRIRKVNYTAGYIADH